MDFLRSRIFWIAAGLLGLLGALFAFGLQTDPRRVPSPLIDQRAPAFAIQDLRSGVPLRSSSLHGQPYVLNFWASWCLPCRQEAPLLEALHRRYGQTGRLRVVGVAVQDTQANALRFAEEMGKTYFLALDNPQAPLGVSWGLYGVPETFFVDAQGTVRTKQTGGLTRTDLERHINTLLGEPENPRGD